MAETKRSEVIHKTQKPAENLYQALAQVETTIADLTRMFMECEDSKHRGVKGMPKLTPKQEMIKKQLDAAQKRADTILKLIEQS